MKKKKFLAFTLCSLLTLTSIQTPWAFSDEAPDDPAFSDGITSDETAYGTDISDIPASENSSDILAPDFSSGESDDSNISSDRGSFQAAPARKPSENSIPITADSGFAALFSENGFPKTLIRIMMDFSLTKKSPYAQKSLFLPCQSILWKASNIFITWRPWTVPAMNCCFSMYQPTQF